jgi:hypothetical protein
MAVPLCCEPHTPSATAAAHSSLPNRAGTGAHLLGLVGLGLCCCSCFSAMYWHTAGGEEVAVQASKQAGRQAGVGEHPCDGQVASSQRGSTVSRQVDRRRFTCSKQTHV